MSLSVVDKGVGNKVEIAGAWGCLKNSQLTIVGDDNFVQIGDGCKFDHVRIVLRGSGNSLQIGRHVLLTGDVTVSGGSGLFIGDRSTIGRSKISSHNANVHIGKDCMFAQGLEIRTTDSHPVFDILTKARINPDRGVFVDDYVWCGASVSILKGAHISKSSVVALGSIVTRKFPPFVLLGGTPARVLRSGITWTRRTHNEILDEDKIAMSYIADWHAEEDGGV